MYRRIISTIIAAVAITAVAAAQPRAIGLRLGPVAELSYQHTLPISDSFIDAALGLDYVGQPGFKGTATWNFIVGDPAWSVRGQWAAFAGAGLSIGYVNDQVNYSFIDDVNKVVIDKRINEIGVMAGIALQAGIEYTFWFPLQLSIDLRPIVGIHFANRTNRFHSDGHLYKANSSANFYQDGFYGLIPTLSARYAF